MTNSLTAEGLLCSTLSDHHMMTGFGPFELPPPPHQQPQS